MVLQEILTWSKDQPQWQQDAIARLYAKGKLEASDLDDLYALLKAEHGIPDAQGRAATTLSIDQVPAPAASGSHVQLLAIKDLQHVNALAPQQKLPIKGQGLTLIYGGNGAGKSGYTRVLKRACRARDQTEKVLPNARLAPEQAGTAQAKFDVLVNGAATELTWIDGAAAPQELSAIAIFDAHCARAYIDDEGDFSFIPYGLDILEGLAGACDQLRERLSLESRANLPDMEQFATLAGRPTAVGGLLAKLSRDTSPDEVQTRATLYQVDEQRHAALIKGLKEDNPAEKLQQLQLKRTRLGGLAARCQEKCNLVSTQQATKLQGLAQAVNAAKQAADLAASQFKKTPGQLPGTGDQAWQDLFEAARKFALTSHVGKQFPHLGPDSTCPLCQQPLGDAGAARLEAFDVFMQQEAEKNARAARLALKEEVDALNQADLSLQFDPALATELEGLDAALAKACGTLEADLRKRRTDVTAASRGDLAWESVLPLAVDPSGTLDALLTPIDQQIDVLQQRQIDPKALAELQKEFDELEDRRQLALIKDQVLDSIAKLVLLPKLTSCQASLRTADISKKSTDLVTQVVSQGLGKELNAEFAKLDVAHLEVAVRSATKKGKTTHKLVLQFPGKLEPDAVLSDGEKRAIAIASFLAEVRLSQETGGVVFDDPVSSMDHDRRHFVAQRLVAEATQRQVLVFSHDLYFILLLQHVADEKGVPYDALSLSRSQAGFGVPNPDLPFDGATVKSRIGILKGMQVECAKLEKNNEVAAYELKARQAYQRLRDAWERVVEEVLLNGVIQRFEPGVSTQRLGAVKVEDSDYAMIKQAMTTCSKYAHDGAANAQVPVPKADELLKDILALEQFRKETDDRNKALKQTRG